MAAIFGEAVPRMVAACSAAARAMGVAVDNYGALLTPALALQAMADGVPAIMVTGSHIPFDRNGIKFYRPDAEITKASEQAIMAIDKAMPILGEIVQQAKDARVAGTYKARYLDWFAGQPLKRLRIGLYQHSAAGRDLKSLCSGCVRRRRCCAGPQ